MGRKGKVPKNIELQIRELRDDVKKLYEAVEQLERMAYPWWYPPYVCGICAHPGEEGGRHGRGTPSICAPRSPVICSPQSPAICSPGKRRKR